MEEKSTIPPVLENAFGKEPTMPANTPAAPPPTPAFPSDPPSPALPSSTPPPPQKSAQRIGGIILILIGLILLISQIYKMFNKPAIQPFPIGNSNIVAPKEISPTKPIPKWETYTSPQGFSLQYESPLLFNQEIKTNKDVLTYYSSSKDPKSPVLQIEVASETTEFAKTKDLPQAKDPNVKAEKLAAYQTLVLNQSPTEKQYFVVENNRLYQITTKILQDDAAASSLLSKILGSFIVVK